MKVCSMCKKEKDESQFWKKSKNPNNPTFGKLRARCIECSFKTWNKWKFSNLELYEKINRTSHMKVKTRVMAHYGVNGKPKCVSCGEERLLCLTIDHVDGGGTQHFKEIGKYGTGFYQWLEKNKYPPGYQCLCANCQRIKVYVNNECHRKIYTDYEKKLYGGNFKNEKTNNHRVS